MLYNGPCFKTYRQITKSLSIFLFLTLSACSPQISPQPTVPPTANTVLPEVSDESTTPGVNSTIEPIATTFLPAPTDTPTALPSPSPNLASPDILETSAHMLVITRTTLTANDYPETAIILAGNETVRYDFGEYIRPVGQLSSGDLLTYSDDQTTFSFVDLEESTLTPFLGNVWPRHQLIQQNENENLIVAVKVPYGQPYPIWAVPLDGKPPILLGTTAGNSPRFPATEDGQVLLLENGHLVLKRIEDGSVKSQSLDAVEKSLALNWDTIDWTKPTYHDNVPYVDFTVSPDGQRLAIFDGIRGRLWVVSTDGQVLKEIPYEGYSPDILGEGPMIIFQDWSPDSQWLGYQHSFWMDNFSPSRNFAQLHVVSIDKDSSIPLTPPGVFGGALIWSPDGQYLAYSSMDQLGNPPLPRMHLYLAHHDGSDPEEISSINTGMFFWHPDSQTLTYECRFPENENSWPSICIPSFSE